MARTPVSRAPVAGRRRAVGVTTRAAAARPLAAALDGVAALVLLVHLAACAGFNQPYSRLAVTLGRVPLFTGEAVIATLLLLEAAQLVATRRLPFAPRLPDWLLVGYGAIGALFAGVGLAHGYGLAVFRDFALVYYAVFYFLARAHLARGNDAATLLGALALGATAGASWQAVAFLRAPTLSDGHGAPGSLALAAWLAVIVLVTLRERFAGGCRRALWLAALAVDAFVIYLSAHRTMAGVIVASLAAFALAAHVRRVPGRRRLLLGLAAPVAGAGLLVATHALLMPALSPGFTDRGAVTLADGLGGITSRWTFRTVPIDAREWGARAAPGTPGEESRDPGAPRLSGGFVPSYAFRAYAWRNAMARIASSPWVGIGFGPPAALFPDSFCGLVSSPLSNCGNAHNTYLTLAMRMGIPVLMFFLAINAAVVLTFVSRLRQPGPAATPAALAAALAAAYAACLAYAWLNLFLESPYLSVIYWVVLACMAEVPPPRPGAPAAGAPEEAAPPA